MSELMLEIITPDKIVYSGRVDSVTLPGAEGQLTLLRGHTPLLSALTVGELYFGKGTAKHHYAVNEGFVQVAHNRVTVIVETAERADLIDVERARRAEERAKNSLLLPAREEAEFLKAKAALIRAITRLKVAGRRGD
jgi:F-type H+-transporting ATPase subunit epsilon